MEGREEEVMGRREELVPRRIPSQNLVARLAARQMFGAGYRRHSPNTVRRPNIVTIAAIVTIVTMITIVTTVIF